MGVWRKDKFCTFPKCVDTVVTCPKGFRGHNVYWINARNWQVHDGIKWYHTEIRIAHAHFLVNQDLGRHIDDLVGHTWTSEYDCDVTVRRKRKGTFMLPSWIHDSSD